MCSVLSKKNPYGRALADESVRIYSAQVQYPAFDLNFGTTAKDKRLEGLATAVG